MESILITLTWKREYLPGCEGSKGHPCCCLKAEVMRHECYVSLWQNYILSIASCVQARALATLYRDISELLISLLLSNGSCHLTCGITAIGSIGQGHDSVPWLELHDSTQHLNNMLIHHDWHDASINIMGQIAWACFTTLLQYASAADRVRGQQYVA